MMMMMKTGAIVIIEGHRKLLHLDGKMTDHTFFNANMVTYSKILF